MASFSLFSAELKKEKIMSALNKSIAGLAGSLALTAVHQIFKKNVENAPDLDQVGEKLVEESLDNLDMYDADDEKVYAAAMGGNILSNAMLFSTLATSTNTSEIIGKTVGTGLLGAAGTIGLAEHFLGNNKATNTDQKKWMTTGYYLFGALVTIGVYNMLERKNR
jgi:hypothetical protein